MPSMDIMTAFRDRRLGVGQGIGLVTDEVGLFEVQATWVPPPNISSVIATGNLSTVTTEGLLTVKCYIEDNACSIGTLMGCSVEEAKRLSHYKPGHQLHFHMANYYLAINSAYQSDGSHLSLPGFFVDWKALTP